MNRRRFLNLIAGTGTAAALAPSMVWPFRKIFLPPVLEPVILKPGDIITVGCDAGFQEGQMVMVYAVNGKERGSFVITNIDHMKSEITFFADKIGLSRAEYPGRLHV